MGQELAPHTFSREDRQRYRQKVRACLDVFARMLAESRFEDDRRSFGLEIELNLTDEAGDPALVNATVLEAIGDADFQTELAQFNDHWNAAQAIAGVQMALAANAPFFFGRELWRETRIALFEQATDTRPEELKAQGVRPRVWFGERWITSIFDLFEENVRYFPPLLPILDDEDPVEVLNSGGVPRLAELRLHNGTIYRWNRPVYDIMNGRPHLRVE